MVSHSEETELKNRKLCQKQIQVVNEQRKKASNLDLFMELEKFEISLTRAY